MREAFFFTELTNETQKIKRTLHSVHLNYLCVELKQDLCRGNRTEQI